MPKLSEVQGAPNGRMKLSQVQKKPKPSAHSFVDAAKRELGLGARGVIRGVYDLSGFLGGDAAAAAESALTGRQVRNSRQSADYLADQIGLPRPETATERVGGDIVSALTGSGLTLGVGGVLSKAPSVAGKVGQFVASSPLAQLVSAGSGAGASGVTRESGGGAVAQTIAGLAGGVSPSAISSTGQMAVRGVARGGEEGRKATARTVRDFRAAGTTPTVGQATGNRVIRATEVLLSRVPGGAGVIANKAQTQGAEIGAGVRNLADDLAPGADPTTAGRAIREGIVGPSGFVERTDDVSRQLYDDLDATIPPQTTVGVQNTVDTLGRLNPVIPGAPHLTPLFQNSRVAGIKDAFLTDSAPATSSVMGGGGPRLPYQGVKQTRTMVGKELQNANFASDVPVGDWKQLYGGLTDDMRAAAQGQGPQAEQAFNRANQHFSAVQARNEAIRHVVNKDTPEAIFTAATQGTDKGATTLNALMKSLPDQSRREVAAAVLDRMGRAVSSQQNAEGTAFSAQTFLTNWDKLSPRARSVLFDRFGPEFRSKVESITRVAGNLREGAQIYANPSGTGAANAQNLTYGALGASAIPALTGNPWPMVGVASTIGGSNALARLLTNPRSAQWLAEQTPIPFGVVNPLILGSREPAE